MVNAAAVQTQKVLSIFYFLEKTKASPFWTICHRYIVKKKALSFPKTTCLQTIVIDPLISLSESEEIIIMCHQTGNYCVTDKSSIVAVYHLTGCSLCVCCKGCKAFESY